MHWHALDAPFTPLDRWAATLETGACTRCGNPARRGEQHWWHVETLRCPDGDARIRAQFRGE